MPTIKLKPFTRIEGHLDIEVTVEVSGGVQQVVDARSGGMSFRGFETILQGRHPFDAVIYTQRICGVCPVSHAMASTKALEAAGGVTPADNGRIMRNIVLGANFVQSHILHLYHLAALDYINTTGILDMSPWSPHFTSPDMLGGPTASTLVDHYVQALAMRRTAHELGAVFGGRMPSPSNFVPGGSTETVTSGAVALARNLLGQLRSFIDSTMVPDTNALAAAFPQYGSIGAGAGRLLAYGVFDLDSTGQSKLLARGRYDGSQVGPVDTTRITEQVKHSWYADSTTNLNPAAGLTQPAPTKSGAYSWIKAPRYGGAVYEVGPLARMWVNGDYRAGIGVLHRLAARTLETKKVADAMAGWLDQLAPGQTVYSQNSPPAAGEGIGLTEAPRGALGHWVRIGSSVIDHYQVVTPTAWNASPHDDSEQGGAIEQALVGTPVADVDNPIEVLRVVHSFDPCLSCSVHMLSAKKSRRRFMVGV